MEICNRYISDDGTDYASDVKSVDHMAVSNVSNITAWSKDKYNLVNVPGKKSYVIFYILGYNCGYNDGYIKGYSIGHDDGYQSCYEKTKEILKKHNINIDID